MAKKSKVAKCQNKKKTASGPKLNPFEIYHKKKKHSVVGVKEKRIGGMPGVSRSRALEKRSNTLGVEYKKRHKKNAFVDERFGVGDATMSAEDKMMARFAVERQKHHSKQRFNLEEDVLTHKGQSVEQLEEFDDIYSSGDEEDGRHDSTTDMHFGGFLTKNEGEPGKHLSGKDIMDEIVAKSKLQKMERQKHKEEATEETAELDKDWTELQGLLAPKLKPIVSKSQRNDYDIAVKELIFEAKAKPTDRLKTDEELAKERRELLEQLESERLQRMRKGEEKIESSADALLAIRVKQKPEKVLISYDDKGNMNKNEEFEKALISLKNKNQEQEDDDTDSDDEEASSEEDGSEEEQEGEEESGPSEESEEENVEELPLITEEAESEDGNCLFGDIVAEETDEENAPVNEFRDFSLGMRGDIPFVIEAPEHISELNVLLSDQDDEAVVTIIKRIIASNYPTLKEENKAKTATFFVVLIKYVVSRYTNGNLSRNVLDESCKALFSVTKHIQRDVYTHFFDVLNSLKHLVAKNTGKQLSAVISKRYIIYIYLIQRIYPITDYKHAVLTPVLMSLNWALSACSVKKLADLKVGVFLCSYVLQCTKGKYSPEVIYFLTQIIKCLLGKSQEYVGNFKIKLEGLDASLKPETLSISNMYENETSKSDVVFALLLTIRTAMRNHHDFTGFNGIFHPLVESLKLLELENFHSDIQSVVTSLISLFDQYSQKLMPFLRYENVKPVSIKMYEPKFDKVYVRERKDKNETRHLKKKIKSEMKGAIREIRKDNKFINRVKHKEQSGLDKARKRKVNEIMGFLSKEQGEANDLKYKKKRGQI